MGILDELRTKCTKTIIDIRTPAARPRMEQDFKTAYLLALLSGALILWLYVIIYALVKGVELL